MKDTKIMKKIYDLLLATFIILVFTSSVTAQEAEKEMKVKIVKEKDGEVTTMDTVIRISELNNLEELELLKEIMKEEGIEDIDIDIDVNGIEDLDVEVIEIGEGEGETEKIMIMKRKMGEEDGEGKEISITMIQSDSVVEGETMRVWVGEDGNEFIVNEIDINEINEDGGAHKIIIKTNTDGGDANVFVGDGEAVWFSDDDTKVEVVKSEDGKTVVMKSKDGKIEEYIIEEESGAYFIGEDGEMKKVDKDVVWTDDASGEMKITVTVEGDSTIIIERDGTVMELENFEKENNVFIYKTDTDGEEVDVFLEVITTSGGDSTSAFKKKVILKSLNEDDYSSLQKSGADMGSKENEKLAIEKLKFHPNPSDGKFTLEFSTQEKGTTEVMIYDINGRQVYQEKVKNFDGLYKNDIDISSESTGTYFLKIKQGDKLCTKKIILD